jgi:hypothetical protein
MDVGQAGMKQMRAESLFVTLELLDQEIRHHQVGLAQRPRTVMIHSEWSDGKTLPFREPSAASHRLNLGFRQKPAHGMSIRVDNLLAE